MCKAQNAGVWKREQLQCAGLAQLVEQRFCKRAVLPQIQRPGCKAPARSPTKDQRLSAVAVKRSGAVTHPLSAALEAAPLGLDAVLKMTNELLLPKLTKAEAKRLLKETAR